MKRIILAASLALACAFASPSYSQPVPTDYETVAASQTDQALGPVGVAGDILATLIITVGTAATAAVSIKDGSGSSIPIMPNSPGGGIGVYVVIVNARSTSGGWKVTTGAGSTVLAVGRFR